eukprot:g1319.t1
MGKLCRPTAEEDEGIRAPIPSKFERIIDQPTVYEQRARERETQTPIYEAFRNHSAELAEYQNGPDAKGGTTGLAKLYKAPIDLLFRGTFEEAKESAMKQNLWLMVNVQSAEEFASHQLNCDTFSNEALKEMIKANFVFFQTYTTGVTGERLTVMYGIQQCPCILIIDPITGGLMRSNYGFIEAERLIEHLIHYMDFTPEDESGAKQLQSQKHRKSKTKDETRAVSSPVLTKEMQSALAEALEDSKKRKSGKSAQPEVSRSGGEGSSQVLQESSPIDHKHRFTTNLHDQDNIADKESKQRQPVASPIPDTNAEDTCVVCILLPNGQRAKRAFHKTDKIEVNHTHSPVARFCAESVRFLQC